MSEELKTEPRQSSADIKKQIAEATKADKHMTDLKESSMPLTGTMAHEINASASTTTPAPQVGSKPELPSGAAQGVEPAKSPGGGDSLEWARKKGITWIDDSSIADALRKADQAFHEHRNKEKEKLRGAPLPAYQPPVQYAPPPPYIPPNQPNQNVLNQIAQTYGIPVEDTARIMPLINDFFAVAGQQQRADLKREIDSIRLEGEKNSVFRELSADPVFKNPIVGEEFHRVMEEMQTSDPQSFEHPSAYKRAFHQAVFNIGRRNLEGRPLTEGVPLKSGPALPNMPPRALGNGSGGGASENEAAIDPQTFAKSSLEDKRKILEGMGLRPNY